MDKKKDRNLISRKYKVSIIVISIIFTVIFILSFGLGHYIVPVGQTIKILIQGLSNELGHILGKQCLFSLNKTWTDSMYLAVINIRFPRILLASLVGACLSLAGATYQGVFSNPMAAPDILGASSGAGFGAALAILMDMNSVGIMILAFIFSLLTVIVVFLIGNNSKGIKIVNLILAGVMISSLFSSGTSFIKLIADPNDKLPKITYWLMGSLSGATLEQLQFVIIPMLIGIIILFILRWRINLLTLDEEEARSLGLNITLNRTIVIILATLVTAASVSVSGMIGWVGLVIPHFSRKLVGDDYRKVIPMSLVMGALFLLIVDNISRNLLLTEIPIGILTAFVGAPFFLYLILRKGEKM